MVLLTSKSNFEDTLNSLFSSGIEEENFPLWSRFFNDIQKMLKKGLMNIHRSLQSVSQQKLIRVLLYENDTFDNKTNRKVLFCCV